ncbi:MAG: hypothetical protein VB016_04380 [Methanomassiliicoccaceae archaeon]|nr:hypothetical protein [Methanomassiliicoccaceae archaeon]
MDEDVELDDYSDVTLIAIMLIGTSSQYKIDHALRIHKLAFLADKIIADSDLDDDFDFDANHFGPFSENLDDSLTELRNWGLIKPVSSSSKGSKLTLEGEKILEAASKKYKGIFSICSELNSNLRNLSTDEIIKLVYRLYPSLTSKSLIKDKLVKTERVDSFSIPIESNSEIHIVSENGVEYTVVYKNGKATITEARHV